MKTSSVDLEVKDPELVLVRKDKLREKRIKHQEQQMRQHKALMRDCWIVIIVSFGCFAYCWVSPTMDIYHRVLIMSACLCLVYVCFLHLSRVVMRFDWYWHKHFADVALRELEHRE